MSDKPKRRWYQLSLRMLLAIPMLVGLGISVWMSNRQFCFEQAEVHQRRAIPNGGLMSFRAHGAEWKRQQRISDEYRHAASMPWLRLWIDDSEPTP